MTGLGRERRHATCVAWLGHGLLLCGPSGGGKSDLALRLVDAGAQLVADDLVDLELEGDAVMARPVALPGHLEVRGLGIFVLPHRACVEVTRIVRLLPAADQARLPEPATETLLERPLPALPIDPTAPSAVARLRLALLATPMALAP